LAELVLVASDAESATFFVPAGPGIPRVATDYLNELSFKRTPQFFARPPDQVYVSEGGGPTVRVVGAEGIFVADKKVAEWGEIARRLTRQDVIEIIGRDSVKNGALIGAAIFTVPLGLACIGDDCGGLAAGMMLISGLMGLGLGVAVDRITPERVIYERPGSPSRTVRVIPLVTRERKGLSLAIRF